MRLFDPQSLASVIAQQNPVMSGLKGAQQTISTIYQPQQLQAQLQAQLLQNQMNQAKMKTLPQSLQEQLRAQQLANQISQVKAQYADPTAQANLDLLRGKYKHLGDPKASDYITKTDAQGRMWSVNKLNPSDVNPVVDPTTGTQMKGAPGLVQGLQQMMSIDPSGQIKFQVPSSQQDVPTRVTPSDAAYDQGGVAFLGGTGRGEAGKTLVDPRTGLATFLETQKQAATSGQALASEAALQPSLSEIFNNVSPLIGTAGTLGKIVGEAGHLVGSETPQYDAYLSGKGTQIPLAAESLMKGLVLPNQKDSYHQMVNAIIGRPTDTKYTLARRIADLKANLDMRSELTKYYLRNGIPLQQAFAKSANPNVAALHDRSQQYYAQMLSGVDSPVQIPQEAHTNDEFKNRWIKTLTPKQKKYLYYYLRSK